MTIKAEIRDMNGVPLALGQRVRVYEQRHAVVERNDVCGVPVVTVDTARPLPVADVPLFEGVLRWNEFEAMLEITVERLWAWGEDDGMPTPTAVKFGGASYAVEAVAA